MSTISLSGRFSEQVLLYFGLFSQGSEASEGDDSSGNEGDDPPVPGQGAANISQGKHPQSMDGKTGQSGVYISPIWGPKPHS